MEIIFCRAKGPGPLSLTTGLVARLGSGALAAATWPQALAGHPSPAPGRLRLRPPDQACYTSLNLSFLNCKTEDCEDSPGYINKALRTDLAWLRRPIKQREGGLIYSLPFWASVSLSGKWGERGVDFRVSPLCHCQG